MCHPFIRILLVQGDETDRVMTRSLTAQLHSDRFQVERVSDYVAALAQIASKQHDLYLVEADLGEFKGLELLQEAIFNGCEAPFILLTAQSEPQTAKAAQKAGAFECLSCADLTPELMERAIAYALDRHRMQQELHQLRQSEERYTLAAHGANDGIWDWNLLSDRIFFSPRWITMLGYQVDQLSDRCHEWFERIHPEDLHWVKREITAHLEGHAAKFECQHRMLHQDGEYRWVLSRGMAVWDSEGCPVRMAGFQTDITAWKQAEEKLVYEALHDTLTGLPNRVFLMERLRQALQLAQRSTDYLFAVLFIDLDRFKVINDSLGHMIGDQLLVAIAQRLSNCLRPSDTIARLGGDEFVILLADVKDRDSATRIADRIQEELLLPFNLDGNEVFSAASVGIAFSTPEYDRPEDLLRDADIAMYRAKAHGRARYAIFHPGMHSTAVALLQIETDLRRAIDRQELQLHYQPIVSLRTRQITGFEALIRWQHPQRGMISPTEFVPIAEETGLITPMGWWVLQEACRQMRQWQEQFPSRQPLIVNVNLSSKQFSPHLVDQISEILAETKLDAPSLKLEITESILMENAESAVSTLTQLKQLGTLLAIDDFGTGYSSLNYLHRFPIDTLKVDRSFVSKVDVDGEQLAIARTIITLAWNLGMEVTAEGVETMKQLAQLRSLQCDYAQGYLFSAPLDAKAIEHLMATQLDQPIILYPSSHIPQTSGLRA
ncbi:MAG: EAL domain-containing protein [Oculatellaceae cyanobacterium Prado106]|jgi:diguanylate cyclase (GGDEF)-like protein/PAS domain S-box-containing protein|nr:EAL domain-containing protein [Oculatellaceae cyanobacterium Prado106]